MDPLNQRIEGRLRREIWPLYRQDHPEACRPDGPDELPFPLKSRLDDVIDVVAGIRDFSLEPYRERVREVVCSTCREADGEACAAGADGECSLESYFPKIVAIIEEELKANPQPR